VAARAILYSKKDYRHLLEKLKKMAVFRPVSVFLDLR
jgi:cobalamin biosynthesis Co2+ chelatase CbiK